MPLRSSQVAILTAAELILSARTIISTAFAAAAEWAARCAETGGATNLGGLADMTVVPGSALAATRTASGRTWVASADSWLACTIGLSATRARPTLLRVASALASARVGIQNPTIVALTHTLALGVFPSKHRRALAKAAIAVFYCSLKSRRCLAVLVPINIRQKVRNWHERIPVHTAPRLHVATLQPRLHSLSRHICVANPTLERWITSDGDARRPLRLGAPAAVVALR